MRDYVQAQVAGIGVERRGAHGRLDRPEPVSQELAERLVGRLDVLTAVELRQQVDPGPFRLSSRPEARMPFLAAAAGAGIRVEFDLDVPAAALLHGSPHGRSVLGVQERLSHVLPVRLRQEIALRPELADL